MQPQSDARLICRYAFESSEAAFDELVARHADLVYSAALRQVGSPDVATDVAQSVFVDLSRKAPSLANKLSPDASLVGWLYRSTRFAALDARRGALRRQSREQEAMKELLFVSSGEENFLDWERISPLLDEALSSLGDSERDAVLLRFFKKHDFKTVGDAQGISADAAQKRVSRALEKLRGLFARRGITTTSAALGLAISTNAVQGCPAGLAGLISSAVVTSATSPMVVAAKTIAMTTLQKAFVAATLVAAIGTGIHETRRSLQLSKDLRALQQQQTAMADQIDQLTRERDLARGRLTTAQELNQSLLANVRAQSRNPTDPTELAVNAWVKRINLLKQRFEQIPQAKIPELQFLKDLDWVEVAANTPLETEADYRRAQAELRKRGENYFVERLHSALGKYLQENAAQWPAQIGQLAPYLDPQNEVGILDRWEIVSRKAFPGGEFAGDWVITEKDAVDPQFDSRHTIDGVNSGGVGPYHPYGYEEKPSDEMKERLALKTALDPVINAYRLANGGKEPKAPAELQPFATTPEQQAALQRVMALINQPQAENYNGNTRAATVQNLSGALDSGN